MSCPLPRLNCISLELFGSVALVKLIRPQNGNSLNHETFQDMLTATRWAIDNPNVRILIQTGEGKYFTTGLDLLDANSQSYDSILPEATIQVLDAYHKLLISTDKILIAAVNGPGVGYGLTSIALFDLVYSVPEAYFFVPFVKWGLCAEACSSFTLPYVLGRQRASKLLLAQDRISAEELRGAGLISELVNGHELMSVVMDTASRLVELPPDSLIVNKRLMMLPHRERLLQANTAELKALRERVRSHEAKSAIKGFIKAQRNQNSVQSKL